MRIAAVFSRDESARRWAKQQMVEAWGDVVRESESYEFVETRYYESSMGKGIVKQLFAFDQLMDPSDLVDAKLRSNQWEQEFASQDLVQVERPLNVDPGYVTEAKLVLATTKDRDHRIYLDRGIFAEVTLYFHKGDWASRPWTYQDYERTEVQTFLSACRNDLRVRYNR